MPNDLLAKLENMMPEFSKGQRAIAKYILEHYERASYMTAAKLATAVGVSESTVVRFAVELGYDGYPEMLKSLKSLVRIKLTSVQRMEISGERFDNSDLLSSVLDIDIENIKSTIEKVSRRDFNEIVDKIINARNIYVLGVRSSAAVAGFLAFYLNLIFGNVRQVQTTSVSEMFEQILHVGSQDVVIGISFPRYSRRTVKAAQYASDRGASVIAITDSESSPLVKYASNSLIAQSDMISFVDSLVAPLSLVNALIVAVSVKRKELVSESFSTLENIWAEYEVYEKTEDE